MNDMEKPKNINPEMLNVEGEIGNIRQQCASMGANDIEFQILNEIEEAYHNKEITPQEAIQKAQEVLNNKQDYH